MKKGIKEGDMLGLKLKKISHDGQDSTRKKHMTIPCTLGACAYLDRLPRVRTKEELLEGIVSLLGAT